MIASHLCREAAATIKQLDFPSPQFASRLPFILLIAILLYAYHFVCTKSC